MFKRPIRLAECLSDVERYPFHSLSLSLLSLPPSLSLSFHLRCWSDRSYKNSSRFLGRATGTISPAGGDSKTRISRRYRIGRGGTRRAPGRPIGIGWLRLARGGPRCLSGFGTVSLLSSERKVDSDLDLSSHMAYFDPDYDTLNQKINPPRVCIDNITFSDCTLVKVDSVNKPGILLEVVQVLSDLDLTISKAYITSDGTWFMDVFHVTDHQGRKVTDKKTIDHIEKALGPESTKIGPSPGKSVGMHSFGDHIAIELIGTDRPGLLSEIFAVLADQQYNVIAAEVWTHNMRVACVIYVNDESTSQAEEDPNRSSIMEEQLKNVLRGRGDDIKGPHTNFSTCFTHADRRLHQLMLADKDYEMDEIAEGSDVLPPRPIIIIDKCEDKGYFAVNIKCEDRPKLLFDIVCTLTDMQFVVSHASVSSEGPYSVQELFISHGDGDTLDSKDERNRVIKCLEAAILRRVSEGFSLELCGRDRVGLLSDVTRVLREYGLSVTKADVTTVGGEAMNVFYVMDASGKPVDMKTIEALRQEIRQTVLLDVKREPSETKPTPDASSDSGSDSGSGTGWGRTSFFSFGNLFGKLLG